MVAYSSKGTIWIQNNKQYKYKGKAKQKIKTFQYTNSDTKIEGVMEGKNNIPNTNIFGISTWFDKSLTFLQYKWAKDK